MPDEWIDHKYHMMTFREFLLERDGPKRLDWNKNPKIGWWRDHDHVTLYHGTHDSRVHDIHRHGLKAPTHGPTAGNISMALEPHTAHGYASMHGGESSFRAAGAKAHHVPHEHRSVLVYKAPRHWVEKHMNKHMRGNMDAQRDNLIDKSKYVKHAASGRADHEHYMGTELRFPRIPKHFLVGVMKKTGHK